MEPTEQNLRAWEEAHRSRTEKPGRAVLAEEVRAHLPDLTSKHVLQLGCGDGGETAELASLGALVTAVDLAGTDLEAVRARVPTAALVHVDFQALPAELRRARFDLVFAGVGSLEGVSDLGAWAAGLVGALRPRGTLLLNERHPVADRLDAFLHWRGDYFEGPTLGQLVTALIEAGLTVRTLEELPERQARRGDAQPPEEFLVVATKAAAQRRQA